MMIYLMVTSTNGLYGLYCMSEMQRHAFEDNDLSVNI